MNQTDAPGSVEMLLEAPEFLDRVLQAAPNGLAVVDADGRILYVNRTMADMFRYDPGDMTGMTVENLIPDRFRDRHVSYRRDFMNEPEAREMGRGRDLFGLTSDNREFPVEVGLSPFRLHDRLLVLASVIDITLRKKAENSVRIHARRMEALNDQLAAYTSAISHDLRAPLRAIRNYVDFLREDIAADLPPQQRQYLDALHTAVREADQMILDLLKLGRLSTRDLPSGDVDLAELFDEIRRNPALPENARIITPSDWPQIEAPRVLLLHIFQNLVTNALKFNSSTPKQVEIAWRTVPDGHIQFQVTDNGIGIDPRFYDRVFDPFERLHNPEEYEGTGIGLSLVKKAVTVLDGDVTLDSQPGKGTTFYVTLPSRRHQDQ